jgi:hypothetical protein
MEDLFSKTHEEIVAARKDFGETKTAKERLEQMQKEQLFAFTEKIDVESFRILCAVLADGTVAKASRTLQMNDATLRSRIAQWDPRDPVRKAMRQLIAWRKGIGRHESVPLNVAITAGSPAPVDFAGLLSDVLDGVLAMNQGNWREQAETLAQLLRPHVRQ